MEMPEPACERFYGRRVKPAVDRVLALVVLVVVAPLSVTVAPAVRNSLGRLVLYRQTRVSRRGRLLIPYKFRTMLPDRRRAAR